VAGIRTGHACRLVGRLPFFQRFWTSLVNRSPNMFTADRPRHRRCLWLQHCRHGGAADFSRIAAWHGRLSRRLSSKPLPPSRLWCCGGQVMELQRPQPHQRRDPRPARSQSQDPRACSPPTATREMFQLEQVKPGDHLRVPARRKDSGGWFVVLEGSSTVDESMITPANPCRSRNPPTTKSWAPR